MTIFIIETDTDWERWEIRMLFTVEGNARKAFDQIPAADKHESPWRLRKIESGRNGEILTEKTIMASAI